jgi:hypothetical protein
VKGHSGDEGNDAEDERVQGGKNVSNPMCRLTKACGEGEGWFGPAELVIARMLEQDDSQRGENDGEELGGAAVRGVSSPTRSRPLRGRRAHPTTRGGERRGGGRAAKRARGGRRGRGDDAGTGHSAAAAADSSCSRG